MMNFVSTLHEFNFFLSTAQVGEVMEKDKNICHHSCLNSWIFAINYSQNSYMKFDNFFINFDILSFLVYK